MDKPTCSVDGCDRKHYARGLCNPHYQRLRRKGDPGDAYLRGPYQERECSNDQCARIAAAAGLCASHYQKARLANPSRPRCSMLGCDRLVYAREVCRKHYSEQHLTGYWQRPDVMERHREASYRWTRRNLEAVSAKSKAWRQANPGRTAIHRKRWRADNPERAIEVGRENMARRKARKRGNKVTKADYAAILAEFGMVCHICTLDIPTMADLHFDHVIPLAKGGPHSADNIRPSHAVCNMRKHAKLLD